MSDEKKLDPAQVREIQKIIEKYGLEAHMVVTGISTGVVDAVSSSTWSGAAANAALSKQQDELEPYWQNNLKPILDDLESAIGRTVNLMQSQDEDDRSHLAAISADSGGMAGNFGSRL
ncbi:hypothetical protein FPZ12_018220 [Amycolatopsis acidicola]|uniref:WXG100 family type VII secretion target n=1 Tax=Amycolatopsis acidicola TaxID=2596893 RepID=A0A5N0V6K7_9PSEU|nr:hypothetical protein [Amycolatopsis acidicola]KAA9160152.1 hypothetical protein FPZ12_018220 [Amycolatopsis acidicola]